MLVFLMEQVEQQQLVACTPEGIETTGTQEVHEGGDAVDLFLYHPQRLGNFFPFAVGQ